MRTNLYELQSYVGQIIAPPPAKYLPEEMLDEVQTQCDRLKLFLFNVFDCGEEKSKIKEIFNWHHMQLILIADALWKAISKTNELIEKVFDKIVEVLHHMDSAFGFLLDDANLLPLFEVHRLKHFVLGSLDKLKLLLATKRVKEPLNNLINKALVDYFKPGRYPALSYADKRYMEIFVPQLQALAEDQREKNWNMRLQQLLIKYNFNNMGIYKFLEHDFVLI
ncbi:MAG: hypothetical protein EOO61_07060 [Hymenobacter sp.]|nr:MAG: hypothetical protein EOO61_07060 [Hymenobacter sp.]